MTAMPTTMQTFGVDLAANAKTTATCLITWGRARPTVERVSLNVDDDTLIEEILSLRFRDVAGIDCPFGWPQAFVEAVSAHALGRPWPGRDEAGDDVRARLRLRETDRAVRRRCGINPISVSADKLGATAMRAAHLLDRIAVARGAVVDRSGGDGVVEVYPAAARRTWNLAKERSLTEVAAAAELDIEPGIAADLDNEHVFDALIAAMVARAHALNLTMLPDAQQADLARVEGWIHLPHPDSLSRLNE